MTEERLDDKSLPDLNKDRNRVLQVTYHQLDIDAELAADQDFLSQLKALKIAVKSLREELKATASAEVPSPEQVDKSLDHLINHVNGVLSRYGWE